MISARLGTNDSLREFYASVFNTMMVGLLISAGLSYLFQVIGTTAFLIANPVLYLIAAISPLILVFVMAFVERHGSAVVGACYYAISALMATSLSVLVSKYTTESVFSTLLITGISFGGLSLYAKHTKKDFTIYYGMMIYALVGLLVAMMFSLFFGGTLLKFITSIAALAIFGVLTVMDVQMIEKYHNEAKDEDTKAKYVYLSALGLYLNFINMFIHLLQLLGVKK